MKQKNCLIWGASGQIGRNLIRKLTKNNFSQNVLIHGHCHQKSQDRMKGLKDLLSELNINNKMIDSSCCGMAGSFGYDSKTYETSKKMANLPLIFYSRKYAQE